MFLDRQFFYVLNHEINSTQSLLSSCVSLRLSFTDESDLHGNYISLLEFTHIFETYFTGTGKLSVTLSNMGNR